MLATSRRSAGAHPGRLLRGECGVCSLVYRRRFPLASLSYQSEHSSCKDASPRSIGHHCLRKREEVHWAMRDPADEMPLTIAALAARARELMPEFCAAID